MRKEYSFSTKPESKVQRDVLFFGDLLTSKYASDDYRYKSFYIEEFFQRSFVWDKPKIDGYIFQTLKYQIDTISQKYKNIDEIKIEYWDIPTDNPYFIYLGELDCSILEFETIEYLFKNSSFYSNDLKNIEDFKNSISDKLFKSIVDSSQRLRLALAINLSLLVLIANQQGYEFLKDFPDFDFCIKTPDGTPKISDPFVNKIQNFYNYLQITKISEILKRVEDKVYQNNLGIIFRDENPKKFEDVFFYTLKQVSTAFKGYNLNFVYKIFLKGTYLLAHELPIELKWHLFKTRNSKNFSSFMSEEDLTLKFILNKIIKKENRFKIFQKEQTLRNLCEQLDSSKKFGSSKKTGTSLSVIIKLSTQFCLAEIKKNKKILSPSKLFKDSYDFTNPTNGIEAIYNSGIFFNTDEEIDHFFDFACKLSDWLQNKSLQTFFFGDEFYKNDFMLKNPKHSVNYLFWWLTLPKYFANEYLSTDKGSYLTEILYKTQLLRVFNRYILSSTCVQTFNDYYYSFLLSAIENKDAEYEKFKNELDYIYQKLYDNKIYSTLQLRTNLKTHLFYTHSGTSDKNSGLLQTLLMFEFDMARKLNLEKELNNGLYDYRVLNKNQKIITIDHCIPNCVPSSKKYDEINDEILINSIGNLFLLERNLNSKKRNINNNNFEYYSQSNFVTTKFFCEDCHPNEISHSDWISKLQKFGIKPYTKKELEHPSKEFIEKRKEFIIDWIVDFLKIN